MAGIGAITATQDTEILKALRQVFGIEADLQMTQKVLENHKHMQEKEVLKAEIETLKARIEVLQSPATSTIEDKSETYNTLQEKLLDAKGLVTGKAT
ncbi:hypothetical protein NHP190002_01700 [Helicobacter ailurogastricus]|uniref:hypothetical protein n=1 Tax=Helicobacter ailurogastricus TaxID=1578720 RepID=UPI00244D8C6E|nr:hypothetical protein [Helicobacter ailurogastricus]GMB89492.1 hypothetical protein NHP190002_01700 [Helicobacter ailurogastricus]